LLCAYAAKYIESRNVEDVTIDSISNTIDELQRISIDFNDEVIDDNIKKFIKMKTFKQILEDNVMLLA